MPKVYRNEETPEGRAFWRATERFARKSKLWPAWKRGESRFLPGSEEAKLRVMLANVASGDWKRFRRTDPAKHESAVAVVCEMAQSAISQGKQLRYWEVWDELVGVRKLTDDAGAASATLDAYVRGEVNLHFGAVIGRPEGVPARPLGKEVFKKDDIGMLFGADVNAD